MESNKVVVTARFELLHTGQIEWSIPHSVLCNRSGASNRLENSMKLGKEDGVITRIFGKNVEAHFKESTIVFKQVRLYQLSYDKCDRIANELVVVRKVAFGSLEFFFYRRIVNALIKEREQLKGNYAVNKEKVDWIGNTLRALADLVYYRKRDKRKLFSPPVAAASEAPVPVVAIIKKGKKVKIPRKINNENQKNLF